MRNRLTLLLAAAALFCFAARSNAQFITFATEAADNVFVETNTGTGFNVGLDTSITGNGTNGTFIVFGGNDLTNLYRAALGLPLNNQQVVINGVTLTTTFASATAPLAASGPDFTQPLGVFTWEITINSGMGSVGAGTVLLSGQSASTRIIGAIGGTANTIIATDTLGEGVHFHSGIAAVHTRLDQYQQHAYQWSAPGRNPTNAVGPGGYLNSGSGSFVGNFAVSDVPEPGTLAMLLGSGIGGSLFAFRRRRR